MAGLVGPAIRIRIPWNCFRHLDLDCGARVATMRRLVLRLHHQRYAFQFFLNDFQGAA
jgi:hypothetical protein